MPKKKPKLIALESATTHVEGKTMQEFYNDMSADTLARTLWGEARGEGKEGMRAVANVILNRLEIAQKRGSFWWGNNIIQICQKPYQFSCWNRSDPNFRRLNMVERSNASFEDAFSIAKAAISGELKDITSGATHYHAISIEPYWAKGKSPCTTLGNHFFYKLA